MRWLAPSQTPICAASKSFGVVFHFTVIGLEFTRLLRSMRRHVRLTCSR
jgi:hypothetical protein